MSSSIFSQDLYMRAWHFAARRHSGMTVPGSDLPYITHVGAVAMEVIGALMEEDVTDPDLAVACALLHDTVEDTDTTLEDIAAEFGQKIANGVEALTKNKLLPKDRRMRDSLRRIGENPPEVWIVKLADRTVNMEPPPSHWTGEKRRAYQVEAREILETLGSASASLSNRLREKIARYDSYLGS